MMWRSARTHCLIAWLLVCTAVSAAEARQASIDASTALIGGPSTYVVKDGDTLTAISARFGIGVSRLMELNRLSRPFALTAGQSLLVDNTHIAVANPQVQITINIAQRLLVLVEGERVKAYPITVGKPGWPTPVGAFTVVGKETDPVWDVPRSIQREMELEGKPVITRMEPSALNPLGRHWIGLSLAGIGIHGTNAPSSIYAFASHGCVRMHPDDVAELFERVSSGTTGVLVYEPVVVTTIDGKVWIEAHPDAYRRVPDAAARVRAAITRAGLADRVEWGLITAALQQRRGYAIDVTKPQ